MKRRQEIKREQDELQRKMTFLIEETSRCEQRIDKLYGELYEIGRHEVVLSEKDEKSKMPPVDLCWRYLDHHIRGGKTPLLAQDGRFCHLCQQERPTIHFRSWRLANVAYVDDDDYTKPSAVPAMCKNCYPKAYKLREALSDETASLASRVHPINTWLPVVDVARLVRSYLFLLQV